MPLRNLIEIIMVRKAGNYKP